MTTPVTGPHRNKKQVFHLCSSAHSYVLTRLIQAHSQAIMLFHTDSHTFTGSHSLTCPVEFVVAMEVAEHRMFVLQRRCGHSHHALAFKGIHLQFMQFLLEGHLVGQAFCTLPHPQFTISSPLSYMCYHNAHTQIHSHVFTCSHTGSPIILIRSFTLAHRLTYSQAHSCALNSFTYMTTQSCTQATIDTCFVHSLACTGTSTYRLSHTHSLRHRHTTPGPAGSAKLRPHLVCSPSLYPHSCSKQHHLRYGATSPCGLSRTTCGFPSKASRGCL